MILLNSDKNIDTYILYLSRTLLNH